MKKKHIRLTQFCLKRGELLHMRHLIWADDCMGANPHKSYAMFIVNFKKGGKIVGAMTFRYIGSVVRTRRMFDRLNKLAPETLVTFQAHTSSIDGWIIIIGSVKITPARKLV